MHKKLFIPGPVECSEEILQAMATPMIGHRTKEYSELHKKVREKLEKLLFTEQIVFLFTCSSTGVMEGSIRNCVDKRCANFINGAFSKRWHQITLANGKEADPIEVEWGKAIKPELVDKTLATGKYDAITFVHNETSTGVMGPIAEIAEVMKKYPDVMFLVDAVSSQSAVKVEFDKLGIDVFLAGTQKAYALPPGLTVAAVSQKAMDKSANVKNKGFYFDFHAMMKKYKVDQTPATPGISHVYALNAQLDRMFAEGLANRFARHQKSVEYVRDWAKKYFDLYAETGYESVTLTTITNTRGISVADLNKKLGEIGLAISNGYGTLKEKNFRIAHMGDCQMSDLEDLLGKINKILGL